MLPLRPALQKRGGRSGNLDRHYVNSAGDAAH